MQNEGHTGTKVPAPYRIALCALLPKRNECKHPTVPVCLSASPVACGSLRTEPTFMMLGQSTAAAAALAVDGKCAVQDISYARLRAWPLEGHQILEPQEEPIAVGAD